MNIVIAVRTFATPNTPSTILTTITMSDLIEEAFEFHTSLCEDENFHYGGCIASSIKFTTTKLTYTSGGVEVPINWKQVALDVRYNTINGTCLGIFYGKEYKETVNHTRVEVLGYDAMYMLCNMDMTAFYNQFCTSYPTGTAAKFLILSAYQYALQYMPYDYNLQMAVVFDPGASTADSLLWQPTAEVYNTALQKSETVPILSGTIKMGTLLKGFSEVQGYNVVMDVMNAEYPFTYLHFVNVVSSITPTALAPTEYRDLEYSSFDTTAFTNIRFGAYGEIYNANNTTDKTYGITGNWCSNAASQFYTEVQGILTNDLEIHAAALLTKLSTLVYRPCKFKTFTDKFRLGGRATITDTNGNTYLAIVMQKDIYGLVGASYTYTCLPTEDYFAEQDFGTYNSENEVITELTGKVNRAEIKTVAFTGSYNDLTDKPTIPTDYVKTSNAGEQTISNTSGNTALVVKSGATKSYLGFKNSGGTRLGSIGFNGNGVPVVSLDSGATDNRIFANADGYTWQLSAGIPITATAEAHADLNTFTTFGTYYLSSNTAGNVDNRPVTNGYRFTLIVQRIGNNSLCIRQIYMHYGDGVYYVRYTLNGGSTWGAWTYLAFGSQLDSYVKLSNSALQTIANSQSGTGVALGVKATSNAGTYIQFQNPSGTTLGYLGVSANAKPIFRAVGGSDVELLTNGSFLPTTGGQMTGAITFAQGSIVQQTANTMPFFLGIDAFASGGAMKWQTTAGVVNALNSGTSGLVKKTTNIQSGTVTISAIGTATALNFGTAFGGVPKLSLTPVGSGLASVCAYASSVTASGATVFCNKACTLHWIAYYG